MQRCRDASVVADFDSELHVTHYSRVGIVNHESSGDAVRPGEQEDVQSLHFDIDI